MKTFILYNQENPKSVTNAKKSLKSFENFEGWEPRLYNGIWHEHTYVAKGLYQIEDKERTKFTPKDKHYHAKLACFLSHFSLWERCYALGETISIVEHDNICIGDYTIDYDFDQPVVIQLTLESMINPIKGVVPHKNRNYHNQYVISGPGVHKIFFQHPHGDVYLAGNTGYTITPKAAKILIDDCKRNGWTQNDLLINDKMFPLMYTSPSPIEYRRDMELRSSSINSI